MYIKGKYAHKEQIFITWGGQSAHRSVEIKSGKSVYACNVYILEFFIFWIINRTKGHHTEMEKTSRNTNQQSIIRERYRRNNLIISHIRYNTKSWWKQCYHFKTEQIFNLEKIDVILWYTLLLYFRSLSSKRSSNCLHSSVNQRQYHLSIKVSFICQSKSVSSVNQRQYHLSINVSFICQSKLVSSVNQSQFHL